jgi:hypothetical protein
MNNTETIRRVQAIRITGTDCPKLPKKITTLSDTEKRYSDPASGSRIENYPIPSFFEFRTITAGPNRI